MSHLSLTFVVCLGPTSTWSFSRRVLSIIQTRVHPDSNTPIPLAVDGDAYQIHWGHASSNEPPDISGLPSIDYALYMLSTVKFHLSPMYRFFDEKDFLCNLYEFYDNAPVKAQESRLWYIQFLMVLAFGEAFLTPVRTAENTENWTRFFTRAMSLLPDITGLWQDPILAIEVLALIALYFHSVDIRDTAYCYVSVPKPVRQRRYADCIDWPCNAHGFGGGLASRSSRRATGRKDGRAMQEYLVDDIYPRQPFLIFNWNAQLSQ